ncbi:hypothetical protein [Breznakiella homolactica]|uniref:Uncharacterized protein n=1 Tax=Breznakiella homolactica TaxID=2798577 RepID=A0A7T7XQV8_9SPIR|nr:hypothetical protein [Breznakiella homolactica]QQO10816.1 hypothetical protein JFL75_07840 [Breznakiella homolactica]
MGVTLFIDDFTAFPIGPFPYDPEHSAMGEYHYIPPKGYSGEWYDPIVSYRYKGPSWLVTAPFMDGVRCMEQMRICTPGKNLATPMLAGGDTRWTDYTVTVKVRVFGAEEPCGVLFRYQTSLMHYGFYLVRGRAEIHRVQKCERTVLASCDFSWDKDSFHELTVRVKDDTFVCSVNGKELLRVSDGVYKTGCIAISAGMPAQFLSVHVGVDEAVAAAFEKSEQEKLHLLDKKRESHAAMKLAKKIDLKNFGAGRQIRFGHLTGTEEMFFIICQHQRRVYKDRYPFISCMTAVSLESGVVLWQIGEPRDDEDVIELTTDLPVQVYDIDNDGIDEVICSWDFTLFILDGATGKIKKQIPCPENTEKESDLCGIEFGRHAYTRLNVDAIRIANVSGNKRPSDILIKDRYSRLWVYNSDLELLWKFSHNNTGHFPYSFDFNGDGKDEIFSCYNMIGSDGKLQWKLPIEEDHTDEIIFGHFDPGHPEGLLAIVSGWEGFMIADIHGNLLARDINGHGQRISTGNYCPDRKGYEICTTTFWENQGIIYLYDCKGNEIWHRESRANGNLISPVNWDGSGVDLILLNGNSVHGGLIDGDGDVVVSFPDDGHPDLCAEVLDLNGNGRDEIVLWDRRRLWVYTQENDSVHGDEPVKYPVYNASNYRGEYSFRKN